MFRAFAHLLTGSKTPVGHRSSAARSIIDRMRRAAVQSGSGPPAPGRSMTDGRWRLGCVIPARNRGGPTATAANRNRNPRIIAALTGERASDRRASHNHAHARTVSFTIERGYRDREQGVF
eukprot:scaffold1966_cov118-Isochrysis_galbana.AAC.4